MTEEKIKEKFINWVKSNYPANKDMLNPPMDWKWVEGNHPANKNWKPKKETYFTWDKGQIQYGPVPINDINDWISKQQLTKFR